MKKIIFSFASAFLSISVGGFAAEQALESPQQEVRQLESLSTALSKLPNLVSIRTKFEPIGCKIDAKWTAN
ncbi:MAG: hypothetical protein HRU09_07075 [Oligoflexales bacterium]|nr:hypothetical protein [Oligoflexales bacterium]